LVGGDTFIDSIDFVGHNFYVDVFDEQPLDLKEIPDAVERTLRNLRKNLKTVGIPLQSLYELPKMDGLQE
jgi:hypothetical protein